MKYVHIMYNDKFISEYINFIEQHLNMSEHVFFIQEGKSDFSIQQRENIFFIKKRSSGIADLFALTKTILSTCIKVDKIILHSLINIKVVQFLFVFRFLLPKCYWFVWGAGLYERNTNIKLNTKKAKIKEFLRYPVIKNMGHIVTSIYGDYEKAQLWYNASADNIPLFMYPASLFHDVPIREKKTDKITMLIGNSADPTNNHKEIFSIISSEINENINVVCPLSYGDEAYAKEIAELGYELFGDSFTPLLDYMQYDQYIDLLSDVDIAVFNHQRQQAMSNIRILLGMGKKVYMNPNNSGYNTLNSLGAIVHDISLFNLDFSKEESENNKKVIREYYSEENLLNNMKCIFN